MSKNDPSHTSSLAHLPTQKTVTSTDTHPLQNLQTPSSYLKLKKSPFCSSRMEIFRYSLCYSHLISNSSYSLIFTLDGIRTRDHQRERPVSWTTRRRGHKFLIRDHKSQILHLKQNECKIFDF